MSFLSRKLWFALSLLVLGGLLTGCAGYVAQSSQTPQPGAGALTLSALTLNFSNVTVGQKGTQTLLLTNSGNASLQVTALSVSDKQFSISGPALPYTISASSSASYTVTFTPNAAGNDSATLSVSSSVSSSPQVVSLSGTGQQVAAQQHTVHLTWDASTSQIIGYLVYRSESAGGSYLPLFGTAISNLAYDDATVASGTTYYYVVTAVDAAGAQSSYSNQATAIIP